MKSAVEAKRREELPVPLSETEDKRLLAHLEVLYLPHRLSVTRLGTAADGGHASVG